MTIIGYSDITLIFTDWIKVNQRKKQWITIFCDCDKESVINMKVKQTDGRWGKC